MQVTSTGDHRCAEQALGAGTSPRLALLAAGMVSLPAAASVLDVAGIENWVVRSHCSSGGGWRRSR